ncbi:MAG: hypothetical protein WEB00_07390 [Dehalococcoidia bacterium]
MHTAEVTVVIFAESTDLMLQTANQLTPANVLAELALLPNGDLPPPTNFDEVDGFLDCP